MYLDIEHSPASCDGLIPMPSFVMMALVAGGTLNFIRIKHVKIQKTAEQFESFDSFFGAREGDKEEIMAAVEDADYNYYVSFAVLNFVTWMFIDFFFALLLAAIVKKEPKKE